jgi:hypothetical protein
MENPGRNIPRAIHWSMVIVTVRHVLYSCNNGTGRPDASAQVLFLLANLSYFVVLDKVCHAML